MLQVTGKEVKLTLIIIPAKNKIIYFYGEL